MAEGQGQGRSQWHPSSLMQAGDQAGAVSGRCPCTGSPHRRGVGSDSYAPEHERVPRTVLSKGHERPSGQTDHGRSGFGQCFARGQSRDRCRGFEGVS